MNRIFFLILSFTICNTLVFCKQQNKEVDSEQKVVQLEKKQVVKSNLKEIHKDDIIVDTLISNFNVKYSIKSSNDLVTTYPISDGKGQDTIYYADRNINLSVSFNNKNLYNNKELDKSDFNFGEKERYYLNYFRIQQITSTLAIFKVSFCMPDTDICYEFELNISKKGKVEINEVIYNDDEW